jgi:DNA replication protein DnaC
MSGVPVKYRDIVATPLSKFAWQTAQKAMQERKGLFLVGEAGSGKTLTMAVLAREILSRGGVLRWENVADLSATLRSAVTGNALLFASTIQILKYAHHLMLDDLGAEQDKTGWFTSVLHQIIDWRYVNDLATSATVNDPSVVDARLLRRLQENAMTVELRKES